MNDVNQCFGFEHGECPTCGRCRCCGQYGLTFPGVVNTTISIEPATTGDIDDPNSIDRLMRLISSVRCDSSFPIDRKTVGDIINEQTETS